ncbi:UDP-glycosyltransferase 91D1 [Camellia lanceoleosa]|uniref:UDP-glycosyltransferase 91D1 n=1 Tax=Camellia lanceoleosa TaxID=1840588 RepID=A0ACC0HZZ4_9ERIC|nr:UDP-glycosyltransferase 91D1 [Camellia lanceoleosa]
MLPFMVDQDLNARVLREKKVGIEIPRGEEDGHLNFQGFKATQKRSQIWRRTVRFGETQIIAIGGQSDGKRIVFPIGGSRRSSPAGPYCGGFGAEDLRLLFFGSQAFASD